MAISDSYPDYDFAALVAVPPGLLTSAARTLDSAAAHVQRATAALAADTRGMTWDAAHEQLVLGAGGWRDAATHYAQVAAVTSAAQLAIADWHRDAPRHAEIREAEDAVATAKRQLGAAAGTADASMRRQQLQQAMDTLGDLIAKREAADRSLTDAFDRSAQKLGGGEHWTKVSGPTDPTTTGKSTAAPKPTAPGPAAPHTGTPGPGTAPAPGTAPQALAGTTSSISPAQAANIAALLARPQGQPAQIPQPPQQPAPLSPPTAPAATMGAGGSPRNGKSGAIDAADIDAALPAAVPLPLSSHGHMTPSSPTPVAPAPPAPPQTTGTSGTDWHTQADTSGRSDAPRTALSSGTPEQLTGRATAGGAGAAGTAAQGQPLGQQPMMPPMMGGIGGGANGRATKVLRYSSEQAELLGHETLAEAVRGGTIAQRPVDAA
jgi:hypothetical protein